MIRRSSVDRREQILEAALTLFTQYGMASVSTRQIARAVGISQPSLYAHFPSADAIAAELCARGFQALHDRFAEVLEEPGTPLTRLARLGRAYIEFGLANPDVYRIAFMVEEDRTSPSPHSELAPDPGLDEGLRTFGVLRQVVAEVLGRNDAEADMVAQTCWASVHGLVSLLLARDHFPWAKRELLITTHLRQISAGIAELAER